MTEQQIMVRVRLTGSVSARRDWSSFFYGHNDLWRELCHGGEIDFPESEIPAMRGAVEKVPGLTPLPASRIVRVKKTEDGIWHDGVLVDPVVEEKSKKEEFESPSTDEVTHSEPLPRRRKKKLTSESEK